MNLQPIIGLEIHTQLKTDSKMFCACPTNYYGAKPNTHTCPVCLGLPGALPTINEEAVRQALRVGLALNCTPPKLSKFDRKNYFYPDLPKGYQISQYDLPLNQAGYLDIELDNQEIRIEIERAHLEEDTAKSTHEKGQTLIDFNKSSIPLLEIVSKPQLRSIEEASLYARKVRQIIRYIQASDADMEKGQLRFDINISLAVLEPGQKLERQELPEKFTPIVEVKNLNSFRSLENALDYEIKRQTTEFQKSGILYDGGNKTTRGWDESLSQTTHQRSKEEAQDYRYFPEPDLPPLKLDPKWIKSLLNTLPELPDVKKERFIKTYQITNEEARLLTADPQEAYWFEQAVQDFEAAEAKEAAKWLLGDITYFLRQQELSLLQSKLKPEHLQSLLKLLEKGEISNKIAKDILPSVIETGQDPQKIVQEKGLKQLSDQDTLSKIVQEVIQENPQVVNQIKEGKESAIMFLVGQVMKKTKGQAKPDILQEMFRKELLN